MSRPLCQEPGAWSFPGLRPGLGSPKAGRSSIAIKVVTAPVGPYPKANWMRNLMKILSQRNSAFMATVINHLAPKQTDTRGFAVRVGKLGATSANSQSKRREVRLCLSLSPRMLRSGLPPPAFRAFAGLRLRILVGRKVRDNAFIRAVEGFGTRSCRRGRGRRGHRAISWKPKRGLWS